MKKITYLILVMIMLIPNTIIAQVKNGIVVYEIDMTSFGEFSLTQSGEKKMLPYVQLMMDIAKDIKLELLFNDKMSIFKAQKSLALNVSQGTLDVVKSIVARGTTYTNLLENKQYVQKKFSSGTYNILSPIEAIDWKLTNEQKKIGKFLCYKAEYKKIIAGKEKLITAWYTPEIPLQFGPLEYVGTLPGLIMELDTPVGKYICSEIKLNPKNKIEIDWPSQENTITKEEYKKLGSEINLKQ